MSMTLENIDQQRLAARVGFLRALGAAIAATLVSTIQTLAQRRARRKSLAHLADLEDWQLDDIGLSRTEVERALADAGIHRDPPQLFDRS